VADAQLGEKAVPESVAGIGYDADALPFAPDLLEVVRPGRGEFARLAFRAAPPGRESPVPRRLGAQVQRELVAPVAALSSIHTCAVVDRVEVHAPLGAYKPGPNGEVPRLASTRLLPREICTGEQRMGQPWRRSVDQPNSRLISPRLDRLVDVEHPCHITVRQAVVPRAHSERGCAEEGQEVGFPVATVWDVQLDVDRSEPNFDAQRLGPPHPQPDACAQ